MKKHIGLILGMTAVLGVNIYFRTFPAYFPQLQIQAKTTADYKISEEADTKISQSFPGYDTAAKKALVKTGIEEFKKNNRLAVKKRIREEYLRLKDKYQDERGQTYLMELDSWNWGRYVGNVLKYGRVGDEVVNRLQRDTFMYAPTGATLFWDHFLYYVSAYLYKIVSLCGSIPLNQFLFYVPLFYTAIFLILLYFFCVRLAGVVPAVIACLFVGLSPVFLGHSSAGWFDKDTFNLLFPLLVVWTYLIGVSSKTLKKQILWTLFSAFWLVLFCYNWVGWPFILVIIIAYELYTFLNLVSILVQYKEQNTDVFKRHLVSLLVFLFFSLGLIFIFIREAPFQNLFYQISTFASLNKPMGINIWPNVLSTVGELIKPSISSIASFVAEGYIFVISLACLLILYIQQCGAQRIAGIKKETIVMLTVWFIVSYVLCFKGIRFVMFILVPLGISFGWLLQDVLVTVRRKSRRWFTVGVVAAIFLCALMIQTAYYTASVMYPLMDDAWYKALQTLKEKTPANAIINTWWDFGDWIKSVSNRRVIFDGQSQNSMQAYWMARALLSEKEEDALHILQMLNKGTFEVYDKHLSYYKEPLKAVLSIRKLLLSDNASGDEKSTKDNQPSASRDLDQVLANKPTGIYVLVDYTMTRKIVPLSRIGNWSFLRSFISKDVSSRNQGISPGLEEFGVDTSTVQQLYKEASLVPEEEIEDWVTKTYHFYSGFVPGEKQPDTVLFGNGIIYRPNEKAVSIYSCENRRFMTPKSLIIFENNAFQEIPFTDSTVSFSVLVAKSNDTYHAIMLDRDLARSLFVRLYFLEGKGLKHFKPFIDEKDGGENHIRVFELVWD